jgi:general secretion pathway protein F
LEQVAEVLERQQELTGRVTTALVYPVLLAVIASGVVIFLLMWFIPRFADLFASFHRELPLLTRLVQGVSKALVEHGLVLLMVLAAAVFASRALLAHPAGAAAWDRLRLRIPLYGPVLLAFGQVRFCRMLGTLLKSGVPLLQALAVARGAVGSPTLSAQLAAAGERIRQGVALAPALAQVGGLLPPAAQEAIAVAEAAGRLPQELLRLADQAERELDRRLRTLVALAEPLLLLTMAAVVGTIVVGMLLPVFDLWNAIQ